jgi:hypothetical protein
VLSLYRIPSSRTYCDLKRTTFSAEYLAVVARYQPCVRLFPSSKVGLPLAQSLLQVLKVARTPSVSPMSPVGNGDLDICIWHDPTTDQVLESPFPMVAVVLSSYVNAELSV